MKAWCRHISIFFLTACLLWAMHGPGLFHTQCTKSGMHSFSVEEPHLPCQVNKLSSKHHRLQQAYFKAPCCLTDHLLWNIPGIFQYAFNSEKQLQASSVDLLFNIQYLGETYLTDFNRGLLFSSSKAPPTASGCTLLIQIQQLKLDYTS